MSELRKCQYCSKSYPYNEKGECCPCSYANKKDTDWKDCKEAIKLMISVEKGDLVYGYCKDTENALERKERLEKVVEIMKRIGYGTDYLEMIMKCDTYQDYLAMFEDEPEQICKTEEEFNLLRRSYE